MVVLHIRSASSRPVQQFLYVMTGDILRRISVAGLDKVSLSAVTEKGRGRCAEGRAQERHTGAGDNEVMQAARPCFHPCRYHLLDAREVTRWRG